MLDCIIVGAGPAGASAAYHLAKQGHSVLVLDKQALPRDKPCGGGVSPQVGQWFDFDFSPAIANKVTHIRFTWQLGDPVETALNTPEPMWMVERAVFDQFLLHKAQEQGAEVRDQTEVTGISAQGMGWTVQTAAGPVECRYLIAADGAAGPLAGWLGVKNRKFRTGGSLEVEDAGAAQSTQAAFDFGSIKNGYIWTFPKQTGYSLGVSTFRGGDPGDLQPVLLQYAQACGFDTRTARYQSFPICLWDGHQPLHRQQALLAGETAGIADPFTAEGIRPSMLSGVKAAAAIHAALNGDAKALEGYTQTMQAAWGNDMAWAQKLAGVFYSVPAVGYKLGVKRPSAMARLSKILVGEMCYGDVGTRAIKRLTSGLIPGLGRN